MHIDNDAAARWLQGLLDGVENSNHAAEKAVTVAMDAENMRRAIINLAGDHYGNLSRQLLAIGGYPHMHKRSENGDACGLCGRDLRNAVHIRQ